MFRSSPNFKKELVDEEKGNDEQYQPYFEFKCTPIEQGRGKDSLEKFFEKYDRILEEERKMEEISKKKMKE